MRKKKENIEKILKNSIINIIKRKRTNLSYETR